MSSDRTEHQSSGELKRARDLSLEPTRPPASVPGYTLQKFLGSGAYGEVWSALDQKTGRRVAIKFYTRRSAADVQLLATEVQKLVVLAADRYVVQLLDVGWDAQPPYYVMDYIEHGSLEDRLRDGEGMPTSDAIELFKEIATGMMHLHGKGVLHCDLKPGNVLLDQDGKPRVADFGQSRLSTDETPALGTLFYMAPEQADLKAVPDAQWDVYGLGALLYSMLTGKPPYHSPGLTHKIESSVDISDRLSEYRQSILSAPKPTEHRNVPGVDRMLADIIDRCIAAEPAKRFDNIQSVLFALRQREMTRARRPMMILGLLGPLLLTAVMAGFGTWAFREAVKRTDNAITQKAVQSNEFAAKLAARSAAEQMDEYFKAVLNLVKDEAFLTAFDTCENNPEIQKLCSQLNHPRFNSDQSLLARKQLIDHELRKQLQPFVEKRLRDMSGEFPFAASWLVNDRAGNQIASSFHGTNTTLGKNYAYRTYFTGLDEDLVVHHDDGPDTYDVPMSANDRTIIDSPHLSAVFISKQSNTWKIAFSAPIVRESVVRGVVVVGVELGRFVEFENGDTQYAMMVDSRPGEFTGAILEHPLFKEYSDEGERIPDALTQQKIDTNAVEQSADFFDPLGDTRPGQRADYDERALAAIAPVTVSSPLLVAAVPTEDGAGRVSVMRDLERTDSGLRVVAVENYAAVLEPAYALERSLGYLGLLALVFLLLIAIGLWLLVNRMLRESRERMAKAFSPSAMSTSGSLHDVATLAAPHDSQTSAYEMDPE